MSIDLITMCRRRLDVSHGELLVAIELADAANDYGDGISVGVDRLADRSRQDPRTVQRQLGRLRELGWLQIVEEGGMRGGRGRPTHYRINPVWIKGDILPGFPDFVPKHYHREKGDNLSPMKPAGEPERVTNQPLKGDKNDVKGDRAVSPDPLTHIPSDARARAIPTGSRGAEPERKPKNPLPSAPPPFDEPRSRARWWNHAVGYVLPAASVLGVCAPKTQRLDDVPLYARSTLTDVCRELTAWAVTEHAHAWPDNSDRRLAHISAEIEARLNRTLKDIRPPAPSERAAAAA